jgi:hypothetical protein
MIRRLIDQPGMLFYSSDRPHRGVIRRLINLPGMFFVTFRAIRGVDGLIISGFQIKINRRQNPGGKKRGVIIWETNVIIFFE